MAESHCFFSSLDELMNELMTLEKFGNDYRRGQFESWIRSAESQWSNCDPTNNHSLQEAGLTLLRQLYDYRFDWYDYCDGSGLFYLISLDQLKPALSPLWWEMIRRSLRSMVDRPVTSFVNFAHGWYFDRFFPACHDWVMRESSSREMNLDLRDGNRRIPPAKLISLLIERQFRFEPISDLSRRNLLNAAAKQEETGIDHLVSNAAELRKLLGNLRHTDDQWIEWCKSVLSPIEPNVRTTAVPQATFLEPILIDPDEKQILEEVLCPLKCWEPGKTHDDLKNWFKHLKSKKCKDSLPNLINYAIACFGVVRGYQLAIGADRLDPYHRTPSVYHVYRRKLEKLIREGLRKKIVWPEDCFNQLCRQLRVLSQQLTDHWLSVVKIAEGVCADTSMNSASLQAIAEFLDAPCFCDSDDLREAKKRWQKLT
jgi:hypothetical protein